MEPNFDFRSVDQLEPDELLQKLREIVQSGDHYDVNSWLYIKDTAKSRVRSKLKAADKEGALRWGYVVDYVYHHLWERSHHPTFLSDLMIYRIYLINRFGVDETEDILSVNRIETWINQQLAPYDFDAIQDMAKNIFVIPPEPAIGDLYLLRTIRKWVYIIYSLNERGRINDKTLLRWLELHGRLP